MSPVPAVMVSAAAAGIILGAAATILSAPAWVAWSLGAAVLVLGASARPRAAIFIIGAGTALAGLYFGLPALLGALAKGVFL